LDDANAVANGEFSAHFPSRGKATVQALVFTLKEQSRQLTLSNWMFADVP
jgi:hypothetical protein